MIKNNKINNQYLKYIYNVYTNYLIKYEKHVQNIYNNWVIDLTNKNYILKKIDEMIKNMIKIYNKNFLEYITLDKDLFLKYEKEDYEIDEKILILNLNSKINPFDFIKQELLILSQENGYYSINSFFKLYFNSQYKSLLDCDMTKFNLYNKIFTPLSITIDKSNNDENFIVKKIKSRYDSLIDNTCKIMITIPSLSIQFIFRGYITVNNLNIYFRNSRIYANFIFEKKNKIKEYMKKYYPQINNIFLTKYLKLNNSNFYFIYNEEEIIDKIINDFDLYNDIISKNFNVLIKDFINSKISIMFNIINLLLIGEYKHNSSAVLLFNLLKDKKVMGDTITNIIYSNLSFYSQLKIKKISNSISSELERLKTLSPENISYEKKIAAAINMPDNVKSYIMDKINEMKTGENNYKLQIAINGLMQFPWKPKDYKNEYSIIKKSMNKSRNYLNNVSQKLNEYVYGHESSKKILIELVGKWIQNPESTGQVIGLVGPPGIGKTLLAKSISDALNIPLSIIGLGGMSDSVDLIGHSFTYAGAQYGMIIRQLMKAGNWRSIMLFDEIDKVAKRSETNEIFNTLIHVTDPNMNQHFQDRFYSSSIDFDLSGVLMVFSYNDSSKIDPVLLDRIQEVKISSYSVNEKILIAQNYILKELCENIGFDRNKIEFSDDVIKNIIENYTLEAGVRELRRKLEKILLKLNIDRFYLRGPFKKIIKEKYNELYDDDYQTESISDENLYIKKNDIISDEKVLNNIFNLNFEGNIIIDNDQITKYLDKPILSIDKIHTKNLIGVINGLYATSIGIGGIVPIQIYPNYFNNSDSVNIKLKLTGNQKKIMRESVTCAFTAAFNLINKDLKKKILIKFPNGFHIHAPDGGTPKDGPSAGCAFATAFISIFLGKEINRTVAMTGEIELTGKISKIGGLDSKLIGAKKAGIKTVYISEENKEDYETIKKKNPELFNDFNIIIINNIIDIVSDPNVILDVSKHDFNIII